MKKIFAQLLILAASCFLTHSMYAAHLTVVNTNDSGGGSLFPRIVDEIVDIGAFESLSQKEPEKVLATKTWDGGGVTDNWSEPANWSGDSIPLSADTVVFDATSVTVNSANVTLDTSGSGTVTFQNAVDI